MLRTQSNAFDFRAAHTIHWYGLEHLFKTWAEQVLHNPVSLRIIEAKPAQPGNNTVRREPCEVTFNMHRRKDDCAAGEVRTMSPDISCTS